MRYVDKEILLKLVQSLNGKLGFPKPNEEEKYRNFFKVKKQLPNQN